MDTKEITTKVEKITQTSQDFKKINDKRLNEIEKKRNVDPLTAGSLSKLHEKK